MNVVCATFELAYQNTGRDVWQAPRKISAARQIDLPARPQALGPIARQDARNFTTASDRHVAYHILPSVSYGAREFHFRIPIAVKATDDRGVWTFECSTLGIYAYGESEADARHAFDMELASSWDTLANESDDNLTIDARELKRKLRRCVERIGG
jgi:hypothetical protein